MNVLGLDINVIKRKRKTASIFIERDGKVTARVPEKLTDKEIRNLIESKEYHIFKSLADWEKIK